MKQAVTSTILLISSCSLLGDAEGRGQFLDGTRVGAVDSFEATHNNDNREATIHINPPPVVTRTAYVQQPVPKQ